MSVIDLKHTTFSILDGYTGPGGPITAGAAGAIGATTITIAGATGAVSTGDLITFGSDLTIYKITAHTETTGNTTSITFTPGLVVAVTSGETIHFNPHQLDIKVGEGTVSFDEHRKIQYILDRGLISEVREGDQEPMDVRFDILWEFLRAVTGSGTPTAEDAIKKRGEAAGWVTSGADPCQPYSVDIKIVYTPICANVDLETIILKEYRYESLNHDAKAGTIASTGKCNILQAISSRSAQPVGP